MVIAVLVLLFSSLFYLPVYLLRKPEHGFIGLIISPIPVLVAISLVIYVGINSNIELGFVYSFIWLESGINRISLGLYADGFNLLMNFFLVFLSFALVAYPKLKNVTSGKALSSFILELLSVFFLTVMLFSPNLFQMYCFGFLATVSYLMRIYFYERFPEGSLPLAQCAFLLIMEFISGLGLFSLSREVLISSFDVQLNPGNNPGLIIMTITLLLKIAPVIVPKSFAKTMNVQSESAQLLRMIIIPFGSWIMLYRLMSLMPATYLHLLYWIIIIFALAIIWYSFSVIRLDLHLSWLNSYLVIIGSLLLFITHGQYFFAWLASYTGFQLVLFLVLRPERIRQLALIGESDEKIVSVFSMEGILTGVLFLSIAGMPFTAGGLGTAYIIGLSATGKISLIAISVLFVLVNLLFIFSLISVYFRITQFSKSADLVSQRNDKLIGVFLLFITMVNSHLIYTSPMIYPSNDPGWIENGILKITSPFMVNWSTGMIVAGSILGVIIILHVLKEILRWNFLRITGAKIAGLLISDRMEDSEVDLIIIPIKGFMNLLMRLTDKVEELNNTATLIINESGKSINRGISEIERYMSILSSNLLLMLNNISVALNYLRKNDVRYYMLLSLGAIIMIFILCFF